MAEDYSRTHPCTVFTHLKISVVLLLIPLVQQLLYRPQDIFEIIGTMSMNTFYALSVVGYAVYSYRRYMYRLVSHGIEVRQGLFIQQYFMLPYEKIQTVNIYKDMLASVFGACKISLDSPGGTSRSYDISAFFSKKYTAALIERLNNGEKEKSIYKSNNLSMLLMCAFWSNPASGLLFISPFISKLGTAASNEIRNILYNSMNIVWEKIAIGISPIAATVANILIMGWATAVVLEFMRYGKFSASKIGEYIVVARGIFNRSITYTRADRVAAVTVNQSLLMKMMGLYSSGIFTIGAGKLKGDKSLVIAAEKRDKMYNCLNRIVKVSPKELQTVRPKNNTLYSYVCLPLWITVCVMMVLMAADYVSKIDELFRVVMLFTLIPLVWWILFRIFAHRHSHLAVNKRFLIVCGFRKWTMQKYFIPFERVQYIKMTQNILQKRKGTCNVKVYLYYEKRAFHTVKHISKEKAQEIVSYAQGKKIHSAT